MTSKKKHEAITTDRDVATSSDLAIAGISSREILWRFFPAYIY
jgi:hypothetical protein